MDSIQLGPWQFRPADFSISDAAQRKELEPLLVKLLCCLATEPGRIFSRQELVDTIWQQSYVDDNAINRAISELRKALQHPALPQSPIRTHHRKGYSLQLPEPSAVGLQASADLQRNNTTKQVSKTGIAVTLLLISCLITTAVYVTLRSAKPVETSTASEQTKKLSFKLTKQQKITWFKGIESRPLISPDKQLLAYSHAQPDGTMRVLVRKLGIAAGNTLQEVALEQHDKLYNLQTWQPQSRNLLIQVINKDGSQCEYQNVDLTKYPQYQISTVTTCTGMAFGTAQLSADHQWLYYSKPSGGIYTGNALLAKNLNTGAVQTLVAAPSAGLGVTVLALSKDGSKLAYILMTEANKPDVFVFEPASREHKRIASLPKPILLLGLEWSIDQQALLLPASNAILQLSLSNSQKTIWQLPENLTIGELSLLNENQAYTSALSPTSATQNAIQLIKVSQPFSSEQHISFMHNAAGSAMSLAVSPKENSGYAFAANWTGGWQLWLNKNGENLQLTEFENNEQPINGVSWSGNGRYIAFVKQGNLYLYDLQLRQLINKRQQNDIGHPIWLPDSSGLVMTKLDSTSQNLWQLDLVSDSFNQLTFVAGNTPQFDSAGQLHYQRDGKFYRYVDGAKQDIEITENQQSNFTTLWSLQGQYQYRFSLLGHIEQTNIGTKEIKQTQLPYQLLGVYPDPHDPQQLYAAVFITPELALELIEWNLE